MSHASHTFTDVPCTACGCLCDDLQLTVEQNRITQVTPACPLAQKWYDKHTNASNCTPRVNGQEVALTTAIEKAAALLAEANSPMIYGLASSSTPGQRAAVRLADCIGAIIDTAASTCHGASIEALQQVGESTCSLGEVRHRADCIVYWGSNPVSTHPRHLERYALYPPSMFIPEGRAGRKLIVVDVKPTETSALADLFVQIEPRSDFDVLWALRAIVKGTALGQENIGGVSLLQLQNMANMLKQCKSGVFFFGRGLTLTQQASTAHANVEALLRLTTELNAYTRFYARRMRLYGDVSGADAVLCWQTGYPFSVNLARGYPRYSPGEYSANNVLIRKETDCCVIVGVEGVQTLSASAQQHLSTIPTIFLGAPAYQLPFTPTVRIPTAVYGIHVEGTAYRMDEVPLPLPALLASDLPLDASVLNHIQYLLQQLSRFADSPAVSQP